MPEISEAWMKFIEGVAPFGLLWAMIWSRSYFEARREYHRREEEKKVSTPAETPYRPQTAIGAAFVDKSFSDALISLAHDMREIKVAMTEALVLLRFAQKHDEQEDVVEQVVRRMQAKALGKEGPVSE